MRLFLMFMKRSLAKIFFVTKAALKARMVGGNVNHGVALKLEGRLEHFIATREVAVEYLAVVVNERVKAKIVVPDKVELAHLTRVRFAERHFFMDSVNVFLNCLLC